MVKYKRVGQVGVDHDDALANFLGVLERNGGQPVNADMDVLRCLFAAGDVRHGSVKRVATAVGEGAVAVKLIHQHLRSV